MDPWQEPAPDFADAGLAEAYDELCLWAAPFGLALLEAVQLRPDLRVLDVGCGTGFPLLELAERLGPASELHGVDPWKAGLQRARWKAERWGLGWVQLHEGVAEQLPLPDGSVDLVVSNNGLNNVADQERAFAECARVARPGAQMVFTMNLPGTMRKFYEAMAELLLADGKQVQVDRIGAHIAAKRQPRELLERRVEAAGFRIRSVLTSEFSLRFSGAQALFQHHFIRLGFLHSWRDVLDGIDLPSFIPRLSRALDSQATQAGALDLEVPFLCFDCVRG
jgi:ubiquinone/menaquinone biosynthesis C-methylase UbiE